MTPVTIYRLQRYFPSTSVPPSTATTAGYGDTPREHCPEEIDSSKSQDWVCSLSLQTHQVRRAEAQLVSRSLRTMAFLDALSPNGTQCRRLERSQGLSKPCNYETQLTLPARSEVSESYTPYDDLAKSFDLRSPVTMGLVANVQWPMPALGARSSGRLYRLSGCSFWSEALKCSETM